MTAKEKAEELVFKFYTSFPLDDFANERYIFVKKHAKNCALIAVDEIIKRTKSVDTMPPNCQKIDENTKEYWKEVKQEIEKM
jgi:hypothetical protein